MARFGRRHPIQPIIKRNNVAAAAAPIVPVPPPKIVTRAAIDASDRRHAINRGRIVYSNPFAHPGSSPIPAVLGVAPKYYIVHEVDDDNPRTRKALQMLSDITNGLLRSGELRGTINQPYLGYKPENTINWSGDEPGSIQEALNRIAAALAALGQAP